MRKRVAMLAGLGVLATLAVSPVQARGASVDRIGSFGTVLAVRMDENFPVASLMRADCSSLIRIERPDGSAVEIQDCILNSNPVMIPAFQGTAPEETFINHGGPCVWFSDYWFSVTGEDVLASSFSYTVTPSGHIHARSEYPAEPLTCE